MPLIVATAGEEGGRRDGRGLHVHAVCALDNGDNSTLLFVLDAGAETTTAASAFQSAALTFRATTASVTSLGSSSSSSESARPGEAIREALFARSRQRSPVPPVAASSPSPTAAAASREALCAACGARCSAAPLENRCAGASTSAKHTDVTDDVDSVDADRSSAMAALHVAAAWPRLCGQVPVAHTQPNSSTFTGAMQASPTTALPSTLTGLHLVRQGSSNAPHAAGTARMCCVDVFCTFACGCAALAAFTIDSQQPQGFSVHVGAVEWIMRDAADSTADTSYGLVDYSPSLITTTVRHAAAAASVRHSPADKSSSEGNAAELELLVAWCRSCPAALTAHSAPSPSPWPLRAPTMRVARLCRGGNAPDDAAAAPTTAARSAAPWQLRVDGRFDMAGLLRLRLPSPPEAHMAGTSPLLLPLAGVRRLHWLPHTVDPTQTYPLLAVLYAAPTVPTTACTGAAQSPREPCLDTVSVCYLKEDRRQQPAMTPTTTTAAPPAAVTGHVLVGPWSVRGLALAHADFCLATALPAPFMAHRGIAGKSAAPASAPSAAPAVTAAAAFRAALSCASSGGSTQVGRAATALLGVFQRPAAEPYAVSRLWRCTPAKATAGSTAAAGATRRAELNAYAPGNGSAFAFVLYTGDGEAARCLLDGYIEVAHTAWTPPPEHNGSPSAAPRVAGGAATPRLQTEKDVRHVANVCALLSTFSPPSASRSPPSPPLCDVAVVLDVQATSISPTEGSLPPTPWPGRTDTSAAAAHARWSFSVQVTHRLRATVLPRAPSPSPALSTFAWMSRVLCWRAVSAGDGRAGGDVAVLVCGHATLPAREVAKAENSAAVAASARDRDLYRGLFELRLTPLSAADAVLASGTTEPASTTAPSLEGHAHVSWLRAWDAGRCTQRVSPSAFAAVLAALGSAAATSATALALLSHTPVPAAGVAGPWGGTAVSDGIAPVAVACVGATGKHTVDDAHQRVPSGSHAPSTDATMPAAPSFADVVVGLDVVALLRSGDVVGWRNGADAVVHLCTLRCASPLASPGQHPLQQRFLHTLLNSGAGVGTVLMELAVSRRTRRSSVGAVSSLHDGDADVLLVLAVGQLVGVVRVSSGEVVQVWDLAVAALSADDGAATSMAMSVAQLQLLPVESACGWLKRRDAARTRTEASAAASRPVGVSWYLLWSGMEHAVNPASPSTPRVPQRSSSPLHVVLQLSLVHWADVAAAAELHEEDGGAVIDLAPPPPPLILLDVNARWRGGTTAAGVAVAPVCVGWASFPETDECVSCESAAPDDGTSVCDITHPAAAAHAPHLCVCDAALLESHWSGAREGTERRSQRLRWAAADPTPSAASPVSPHSLFTARVRASCVGTDEEPPLPQQRPDRRGDAPLLRLQRPCLSYTESGSAPPVDIREAGFALTGERVLCVAALELTLHREVTRRADHAATPHTSSWYVLLCTLQGTRDTPAPTSGESVARTASFLLCCMPRRSTAAASAATDRSPALAWHWLPLRLSSPAPQQDTNAAVAVASALPISASQSCTDSTTTDRTQTASLTCFVCTAFHQDASAPNAQRMYALTIHAADLQRALAQSMTTASVSCSTISGATEAVYTYDSVDPRIIEMRLL